MFDSLKGYEIQKIDKVVDFAFQATPHCKVRNSSYEVAIQSKNKILRDFWETQSLKNGLNKRFWKKIARLWLRHLRFESLYLCQEERDTQSSISFFFYKKKLWIRRILITGL